MTFPLGIQMYCHPRITVDQGDPYSEISEGQAWENIA